MSDDVTKGPAAGGTPRIVTPLEIQQKEFAVSRFGGYRMKDVDEFLDQLTESATAMLAENDRLRRQAGAGPAIVGTPDLEDVGRQADEIIQRARDEAARVVAEAKERAASMAGVSAASAAARTGGEEERAAVNAFLAQEREFLQSLASLVQGHAESVKGMARQAKPSSSGTPRSAPPAPPAPETRKPGAVRPEPGRQTPNPETEATQAIPPADEPIRVDEPERTGAPRADDGDASLRDLFWSEDD